MLVYFDVKKRKHLQLEHELSIVEIIICDKI